MSLVVEIVASGSMTRCRMRIALVSVYGGSDSCRQPDSRKIVRLLRGKLLTRPGGEHLSGGPAQGQACGTAGSSTCDDGRR